MTELHTWHKFMAGLNKNCEDALSPKWICPNFPGDERLWLQSMICDAIYRDATHWLKRRGVHGFPHQGTSISHLDSWNVRQNRLLDLRGWCNDVFLQIACSENSYKSACNDDRVN